MEIEDLTASIEHRLQQLWKISVKYITISPKLSSSYSRQMIKICEENNVSLANSFYWNCCSRCALIWIPSLTCTIRLWSYRKIKSSSSKKCNGKFLFMHKVMYCEDRTRKNPNAHYIVYKCKGCNYYCCFDNYPILKESSKVPPTIVETVQPRPSIVTIKNDASEEKRKMAQLQKILQKGKSPILGNFLKGQIPK